MLALLMPAALPPLELADAQRVELLTLARSATAPAAASLRARMILLCAARGSNNQITIRFDVKAHTVGMWRKRFEQSGCGGLHDCPRSGRPPKMTAAIKRRIVTTVCRKPHKGLGRWTIRTLATKLGINRDVVHRTLGEHDLQPHRLRSFNFSPEPHFEEKLLEVVGLYMTPPDNALVLCVEEKIWHSGA